MTAEEALAAAEAEGLPLVVNARDHKNGHAYKHVSWASGAYNLVCKKKVAAPDGSASMPIQQIWLGAFATAEEAALVYARLVGKEAAELENSQAEKAEKARASAQSKEEKRAAKAAERIAEKEAKAQAKAQAKVQAAKVRCAFR